MGGVQFRGNLDVYNVTNGATILGANDRFGSKWLQPAATLNTEVDSILSGRMLHLSGSLEF